MGTQALWELLVEARADHQRENRCAGERCEKCERFEAAVAACAPAVGMPGVREGQQSATVPDVAALTAFLCSKAARPDEAAARLEGEVVKRGLILLDGEWMLDAACVYGGAGQYPGGSRVVVEASVRENPCRECGSEDCDHTRGVDITADIEGPTRVLVYRRTA